VIGGRLPVESAEAGISKEIVARIDALSDLMKDLLLFARPPRPQTAPVDIPPLVRATADLLTADPAMSGLTVGVRGATAPVLADAGLLKIVFVNLLANAAHAMKGRGHIHVAVRELDRRCVVTIADEGPGIPPDVREKVFTPFFTTKSRGTGLGLSTARRLIEAQHGSISIDCPPQGGTTVTLQLPLQQ
jgi:two-component system sensor histidine kinase PilS (NtrC family)